MDTPRPVDHRKGAREVIAVDFDLTLCAADNSPMNAMIRYTNHEFDKGNYIVIYTARIAEDRPAILAWLREYGVKFDCLVTDKLRYDKLIDDRAFRPEEVTADYIAQEKKDKWHNHS